MKQVTRAMIAAAAAEKVSGQHVETVYDHAVDQTLSVTCHLPPGEAGKDSDEPLVLDFEPQERISLQVRADLFSGLDHHTGAYFAGAIYESDVMLYDGYEGRYYKFSVH